MGYSENFIDHIAELVTAKLKADSVTINDLARTDIVDTDDLLELNAGRSVKIGDLKKFIMGYDVILEILGKDSIMPPTDSNVFSARRSLCEISNNNELLKKIFLRSDQVDSTEFLLKLLGGVEVGEFIDSMTAGKGAGIFADGRAQVDRLEVRGSMTVMDLIINQIQGMEADYSFSEIGKINSVEYVGENTYKLIIDKRTEFDFTKFQAPDVCFSIVNSLLTGGTDYYTSWMRVINTNVNDNSVTVVLYPDAEVPGGRNFPPVAGYNMTRRGNARLPEDGQTNERAQSWMLSSREGRIMFLSNVYKPILEDYNYALTIGKLPDIEILKRLKLNGQVGMYAETIVAQNFYSVDWNGDVISKQVDRGEWSLATAQSDKPYRYIATEAESGGGKVSTQLEQHTVYYHGCKWGCIVDKTAKEPIWNSPDWTLLEGDKNYHLTFESSNGSQFHLNNVDTVLTVMVSYGNRDITNVLMVTEGVQSEWLRDTGNAAADLTWKPDIVDGQKNVIHITLDDMGSEWGHGNRQVSFIFRLFIPVGEDFMTIEDRVNVKL